MISSESYNLLKILKKNDIDFIATAVSSFHALGIDAFILDLSTKLNRKPKGLIIICPHHRSGYLIDKEKFSCENFADVEFHHYKKDKYFLKNVVNLMLKYINIFLGIYRLNNKNKNIYFISPLEPEFSFIKYFKNREMLDKYYPIFIIIDEGFGTYLNNDLWKKIAENDLTDNFFGKFKYRASSTIYSFLKGKITKKTALENRYIFEKKGGLKINKEVVDSYKKILKIKTNLRENTINKRTILIITQPFSEYNQITLSQELNILDKLSKFIAKRGFRLLLKPHPRETPDKYSKLDNIEIIVNNSPVEDILRDINPNYVIGYTSTALINANLFYDINTISIAKILIRISDDKLLNTTTTEFIKLTNNFIKFINTVEDLDESCFQELL